MTSKIPQWLLISCLSGLSLAVLLQDGVVRRQAAPSVVTESEVQAPMPKSSVISAMPLSVRDKYEVAIELPAVILMPTAPLAHVPHRELPALVGLFEAAQEAVRRPAPAGELQPDHPADERVDHHQQQELLPVLLQAERNRRR